MESDTTLDDLYDQLDALYEELDPLIEQQDALWDTLLANSTDTDGDGQVDVDETSEEYQQILELDKQIEPIWEKIVAIYDQIDDLLGDDLDGTDGGDGGDGNDDDLTDIEINVVEGTADADTLNGTDGHDDIFGGDGNDVLSGGAGEDLLFGGNGDDTMTGGDGMDWFVLDGGNDTVTDFNAEEDILDLSGTGVSVADISSTQTDAGLQLSWEGGGVLLQGVTGELNTDWILTDADLDDFDDMGDMDGNDDGMGDGNDDDFDDDFDDMGDFDINVAEGTDDADTLTGTDGYDDLYGGKGNDSLDGGADIDYLFGGEGDDTMTGGADMDVFFFGENSGNDVITDFNVEEDILDFSEAGISADDITTTQQDGGTLLSWDGGSVFLQGVTDAVPEESLFFDHF